MDYDLRSEKFVGVEDYYFDPYMLLKMLYPEVYSMVIANGIKLHDKPCDQAQKIPVPSQTCQKPVNVPQAQTYEPLLQDAQYEDLKTTNMEDLTTILNSTQLNSPFSDSSESCSSPSFGLNETGSEQHVFNDTDVKALWAVVNNATVCLEDH